MPNKNRSKDTKDSATKGTLNPPSGGRDRSTSPAGPDSIANPSSAGNQTDPSDRAGQFTGRGASGLQKK